MVVNGVSEELVGCGRGRWGDRVGCGRQLVVMESRGDGEEKNTCEGCREKGGDEGFEGKFLINLF